MKRNVKILNKTHSEVTYCCQSFNLLMSGSAYLLSIRVDQVWAWKDNLSGHNPGDFPGLQVWWWLSQASSTFLKMLSMVFTFKPFYVFRFTIDSLFQLRDEERASTKKVFCCDEMEEIVQVRNSKYLSIPLFDLFYRIWSLKIVTSQSSTKTR